jgi:outer membrane protein
MCRKINLLIVLLGIVLSTQAQDTWSLKRCIDYAFANNISVKQTDLQAKVSKLNLYQSQQNLLPTANFSTGGSFNNGRNQDPTTFSLITQSFVAANMQLQSSADIFNWFSKRNTIAANMLELQASLANSEKIRNDIALNVATLYLQVLLSKEQEKIAAVQIQQSKTQLDATRKRVNAGALPELNAAELEAQVASDSASIITAKGNTQQNILSLKALLALDAATPFEVDVPPVDRIPIEDIASLQPEVVYASAMASLPQQRVNDFKIKAAERNMAAAKGNMYPTIGTFATLNSAFNSRAQKITGSTPINAPLGKVNVGGTDYNVFPFQPFNNFTFSKQGFFSQMDQNFRQGVGLSISVPILNGAALRTAYQRSKINIENLQLQQQADNQKLKQDIYTAYNSAMVALEKYNAGKKTLEATQKTLSFSQKRFDVGMLGVFELIANQNNAFTAQLNNAFNQYDYVFKMKVLEFYKGKGLKL